MVCDAAVQDVAAGEMPRRRTPASESAARVDSFARKSRRAPEGALQRSAPNRASSCDRCGDRWPASRPAGASPSSVSRADASRSSALQRSSALAPPSASQRSSAWERPSASLRSCASQRSSAWERPSAWSRSCASQRSSASVRLSALQRPSASVRPSAWSRSSASQWSAWRCSASRSSASQQSSASQSTASRPSASYRFAFLSPSASSYWASPVATTVRSMRLPSDVFTTRNANSFASWKSFRCALDVTDRVHRIHPLRIGIANDMRTECARVNILVRHEGCAPRRFPARTSRRRDRS